MACPPLAEPLSLGPLIDAFRCEDIGGLRLSPLAGALRPLLPEWAADLPEPPERLEDPTAVKHRLFRALTELVHRLDTDLMVVEDVHWADPSTLEFLVHLSANAPGDLRLLLTYRPSDVPRGSGLLRMTSWAPTGAPPTRVVLQPLDLTASRQLVASMFDSEDVPSAFVDFLHHRTDGVPLALEESVSLLRDRGDVGWRDGEWLRTAVEGLRVPPTVRDSVIERVSRLDPATSRILEAAAVLADPSDEALLREVAGIDEVGARNGVARALSSGLLHEEKPGRYGFRHVLASLAVEEATPASELSRLHGRAAEALQRLPSTPRAQLARHFRRANNLAAWRAHTEAAADLALESGDDRSAMLLLLDLLSGSDVPADSQARIARKLGEAACWGVAGLGELGGRIAGTLRAVLDRDTGPSEDRAETRLLLGRLLLQLGEFDAAAEAVESAVADLPDRPELAARAMISLAWPRGHAWQAERHRGWLHRASRLIPQVVEPSQRLSLEVDELSVRLMLGQGSAWPSLPDLGARGATLFERRQLARLMLNTGHVAIAWGRDGQARERLQAAVALMESTGYRRLLNSARLTIAYLDWHSGNWKGLGSRVRRLANADDTLPEARLEARGVSAMLETVTGDRRAAQEELRATLEEAVRRGLADSQPTLAAAFARGLFADGLVEEALAISGSAVDTVRQKGMWLWASAVVVLRLDVLVHEHRLGEAADLVHEFEEGLAGTADVPAPEAALTVARGILASANREDHRAIGLFASAARQWSALPRPHDELLVLERQANAELAAGHDDVALSRLEAVQGRLQELGASSDADRLAMLLRRHGVEVARVWRGGRRGYGDRLSPREGQVARLVATGLTNRQVAEQLFLSPRTVDRHLGSAMRKLGVNSRTALAVAFMHRRDEAAD